MPDTTSLRLLVTELSSFNSDPFTDNYNLFCYCYCGCTTVVVLSPVAVAMGCYFARYWMGGSAAAEVPENLRPYTHSSHVVLMY